MKAIAAVYKPSSTIVMFSFLQTLGKFQWVDNWKLSFTKWGVDEPKKNYGCVYMDVDRKWKTAPCSETHYSLCKKSPGQTILQFVILHMLSSVVCHLKSLEGYPCNTFSAVAPTEPPQLPGNCPESRRKRNWIPFRGHCYSFVSSSRDNWAHASVECLKMGMA